MSKLKKLGTSMERYDKYLCKQTDNQNIDIQIERMTVCIAGRDIFKEK